MLANPLRSVSLPTRMTLKMFEERSISCITLRDCPTLLTLKDLMKMPPMSTWSWSFVLGESFLTGLLNMVIIVRRKREISSEPLLVLLRHAIPMESCIGTLSLKIFYLLALKRMQNLRPLTLAFPSSLNQVRCQDPSLYNLSLILHEKDLCACYCML